MLKIAEAAKAPYTLLYTKYNNLVMGYFALDRCALGPEIPRPV